jgi:hypothetical protein
MSLNQEFGTIIKDIAHDYKNQLGILETLIRDVKSGYQVDQESCDDGLEAVRKTLSLSKILQLGGSKLEEINNVSSLPLIILPLFHFALQEEIKKTNNDEIKEEFILSSHSSIHGTVTLEDPIYCTNNISIKEVFELIIPSPKAGTSSTARASIALAKLAMKISQVSTLEITLYEKKDISCKLCSAILII